MMLDTEAPLTLCEASARVIGKDGAKPGHSPASDDTNDAASSSIRSAIANGASDAEARVIGLEAALTAGADKEAAGVLTADTQLLKMMQWWQPYQQQIYHEQPHQQAAVIKRGFRTYKQQQQRQQQQHHHQHQPQQQVICGRMEVKTKGIFGRDKWIMCICEYSTDAREFTCTDSTGKERRATD
jgi:hypothetical protein